MLQKPDLAPRSSPCDFELNSKLTWRKWRYFGRQLITRKIPTTENKKAGALTMNHNSDNSLCQNIKTSVIFYINCLPNYRRSLHRSIKTPSFSPSRPFNYTQNHTAVIDVSSSIPKFWSDDIFEKTFNVQVSFFLLFAHVKVHGIFEKVWKV